MTAGALRNGADFVSAPRTANPFEDLPTPEEGMDDARHFAEICDWLGTSSEYQRAQHAVQLLHDGLGLIPPLTPQTAFPNVVGGTSCLTLATRQIRAATQLVMWGYYTEVRCLLRAAYESASLARMLAHDSATAERWLQRSSWVPQKHVDKWSGEGLGFDEETVRGFCRAYGEFSAFAHPSARAALTTVEEDGESMRFCVESRVNLDVVASLLLEIEAVAVFACFAMRNAAVNEEAIDPVWREALHECARTTLSGDLPHLQRDWQSERDAFARLRRKARDAGDLDQELRINPNSWDNLRDSK